VRRKELLHGWQAAHLRGSPELPLRWIISVKSQRQLPAALHSYSLWSGRHFRRVDDQSVPPNPGESCTAPLGLRKRGPISTKGTPDGALWQGCEIFSQLNAKKAVYTSS
jgi:hypothetical protein